MLSPESVRIVFMGTSRFAVPSLEALVREGYRVAAVVSQPPRPAGRGRKPAVPPTMGAAERLGLLVLAPEQLKAPESVAQIARLEPDLIVVAAYAQFLPRSVLSLPPRGSLNLHGSLLPRWRGAAPMQAAILAGDEFTGVTLMAMAPAMDAGPILAQSRTRIEDSDTAPILEGRLAGMGAALLLSMLPCYLAGALEPVPQDDGLVTFAPVIPKEAGAIDWSQPAEQIWRMSRAYRAWPGCFTYWRGRLLKVISCRPERAAAAVEQAGTVVSLGAGREIGVVTGAGVLRLLEVAQEGGRPMGAREFAIGHRGFVGSRLGQGA